MANKYLLPIYREIFGQDFSYASFEDRLMMQKAIYLLQEIGVPVSDYGFSWYIHGPYSQALLDDAHIANESNSAANLSALSHENLYAIERLKAMLAVPAASKYTLAQWCECIASIQYLRQKVLPRSCEDEKILSTLFIKKPHLNEAETNKEALTRIHLLFS